MTDSTGEQREGRIIARIPEDTYAHRLMLARATAGHLSIREAAEKCGLNYATWANWEHGTRRGRSLRTPRPSPKGWASTVTGCSTAAR